MVSCLRADQEEGETPLTLTELTSVGYSLETILGIGIIGVFSTLCLFSAALNGPGGRTEFLHSLSHQYTVYTIHYTHIRYSNDAITDRLFGGTSCGYGLGGAVFTPKKKGWIGGMEMTF